jgi:hypothetical protein
MRPKISPPASEKIAQAKLLYDAGAPIAQITTLLGMTASQFLSFREKNDWPKRASVCPRKSAQPKAGPAVVDPGGLIVKLEDAVAREFARVEAALEKQNPKTIEMSARALATLVKTLAELKRMRREADETKEDATRADDDRADEPPRELAELRAELARRLERLRGDRPPE